MVLIVLLPSLELVPLSRDLAQILLMFVILTLLTRGDHDLTRPSLRHWPRPRMRPRRNCQRSRPRTRSSSNLALHSGPQFREPLSDESSEGVWIPRWSCYENYLQLPTLL